MSERICSRIKNFWSVMLSVCEVKCQHNGSRELRLALELDFLPGSADFQTAVVSQQYRN